MSFKLNLEPLDGRWVPSGNTTKEPPQASVPDMMDTDANTTTHDNPVFEPKPAPAK